MRLSAFWQAVIVLVGAWIVFKWAFPPFLPMSLMVTYMSITLVGVALYFSSDDQRLAEFSAPVLALLRDDDKSVLRWVSIGLISTLGGYLTYDMVKPSLNPPLELQQVHPAPPSSLSVYNKNYQIATLENPVRAAILAKLDKQADAAWQSYQNAVLAGRNIYFSQCVFCHGAGLDGKGVYAKGFDPLPTNFRGINTIAQLQESFLFWRITTGGPGLPPEGMPWKSSMPVWHQMLSEEEVWNVIIFLYDFIGQVPQMWDQALSRSVTGMNAQLLKQREKMTPLALYQFYCASCHGKDGAGNGVAADYVSPRPRDFTQGLFKFKTSADSKPPLDEDLIYVIEYGLPGTSMPGWKDILDRQQIEDLVAVTKSFDSAAVWSPESADEKDFDEEGHYVKDDFRKIVEQLPLAGQIPYTPESIAKGKVLYEENCIKCHGEAGRGNLTSGKFLEDDFGYRTWPRDLTKAWTFRMSEPASGEGGKRRDAAIQGIYTRLSIGMPGSPMPAFKGAEGDVSPIDLEGRWQVANFVYSLRAETQIPGASKIVRAQAITDQLPSSVDDPAWASAPASTFRLEPNVIKDERMFKPLNDAVTVRALYNDTEIGFLLEINDRTDSRPGGPIVELMTDPDEEFSPDAVAIQFPKEAAYSDGPVDKPLFRHGDPAHPVTIWYWQAESVEPPAAARGMLFDARGPDKPLILRDAPEDANRSEQLETQGKWQAGRWRVLMKRARNLNGESSDLQFKEERFIPISFANWDGSNGETSSKHTLSSWYWLLLPPQTDFKAVYGLPLGTGLVIFFAAMMLVRWQRKRE